MNYRDDSSPFGQDEGPVERFEPSWLIPVWFSKLPPNTLERLKIYQTELFRFNEKLNLISPKTKLDADRVHFADSILASQLLFANTDSKIIYDIGSGNGFPGLVMAILDSEREFVLIDIDERKIEFLKVMISRLGLKNCRAEKIKLEDIPDGTIECAVSRAFAPLGKAVIKARKAFKKGGKYYHMKSDTWASEVMEIPVQACTFWSNDLVGEYRLPQTRKANFLVVTTRE